MRPSVSYRCPVTVPIDTPTFRRLLLHEAHVHAVPARQVTDLGDSILLLDPSDPEPFWNRLAAVHWPDDHAAFDRRLTEVMLRFVGAARQPHVWLAPPHDRPADIGARLVSSGFEDTGKGLVMATRSPDPFRAALERVQAPDVEIRTFETVDDPAAAQTAGHALVDVLLEAFGVPEDRRPGVVIETLASLRDPRFTHYLVTVGGAPAAVARRATFDGITYLSSIGTKIAARGRGLGRLVTARAALDGLEAGSEWVHLGVFEDNEPARDLYGRLGFVPACHPGPDMLLLG
jgi:GNAT superfamily N-acetyltransferase